MNRYLFVIDYQNDFVDGALGFPGAEKLDAKIAAKVREYGEGHVLFTRDTHFENYLQTREGRNLPVVHCIKGTPGWEIDNRLTMEFCNSPFVIEKPTFGSTELMEYLSDMVNMADEIEFVGLCTDICVISNALMAKAGFYDKATISCDAACCAGVTPEKHAAALEVMKSCQIIVKE